jgi:hypothetical protein
VTLDLARRSQGSDELSLDDYLHAVVVREAEPPRDGDTRAGLHGSARHFAPAGLVCETGTSHVLRTIAFDS